MAYLLVHCAVMTCSLQLQAQQQPAAAHAELDLMDLLGGGSAPAAASPAAASAASSDLFGSGPRDAAGAAAAHRPQVSTDLDDLFGAPAPVAAAAPPPVPEFPPITAWEKDGLRVEFQFSKPLGTPSSTEVSATYANSGGEAVSDFTLQVGTDL